MQKQATVFYVDDNPKSRELLTNILEERGFAVIASEDPIAAMKQARTAEFEIALLDYQMPAMMGTQLARELKRIHPNLPVVVISGLAALPANELTSVNVHLGRGTRLDLLLETLEMLTVRGFPEPIPRTAWHEST
jgi:CheY-like chemotaxis protein